MRLPAWMMAFLMALAAFGVVGCGSGNAEVEIKRSPQEQAAIKQRQEEMSQAIQRVNQVKESMAPAQPPSGQQGQQSPSSSGL